MDEKEFHYFRKRLQRTQKEMAQLLGTSLKAVQSYEQGWRNIPAQVERLVLFFLALKMETTQHAAPCWEIRRCTPKMQKVCPSWEYKSGHLCWFINGTVCQGKPQASWRQKIVSCKKCEVFISFMNYWGQSSEHKITEGGKEGKGSFFNK